MSQLVQIQKKTNSSEELDCQTCGACCSFFARKEGIIDADTEVGQRPELSYFVEEEITFEWPDGDRETIRHEGFVMKTKVLEGMPACIALEGEVGKHVSCTVYPIRPTPCRKFEAGTPGCLNARRWAGIQ